MEYDSLRAGSCTQAVSKPVWNIPLPCAQWKTPDDGQRNCPKHVEFYSKNKSEKLMHLVGFIIRIYIYIYIYVCVCVCVCVTFWLEHSCLMPWRFHSKNKHDFFQYEQGIPYVQHNYKSTLFYPTSVADHFLSARLTPKTLTWNEGTYTPDVTRVWEPRSNIFSSYLNVVNTNII